MDSKENKYVSKIYTQLLNCIYVVNMNSMQNLLSSSLLSKNLKIKIYI